MPKIALCNFIPDLNELKKFAKEHGFSGIAWPFDINELPVTPLQQSKWIRAMADLNPIDGYLADRDSGQTDLEGSPQQMNIIDPDRALSVDDHIELNIVRIFTRL